MTYTEAQPAVEPVSLTDAKEHLRIDTDFTAQNDYVENLIVAARQYCEQLQHRRYITREITVVFDSFCESLKLPLVPIGEIVSVKYYDQNNQQQTLDSGEYELVDGVIQPAYDKTFPSTRAYYDSVEVVYECGYGEASSDVPMYIKQAILLIIGHWYEHREDSTVIKPESIPNGAISLLNMGRMGLI